MNLGSPAGREKPNIVILTRGAGVFGIGLALAALMPDDWLFGLTLVLGGVSALTFSNTTNSVLRLSTAPAMRGRILAIRLAIALGSAPIGAPILG